MVDCKKYKPVCCIAIWISIIMLLLGLALSTIAGYYIFNPDAQGIINANQLLFQLTVAVFVFGLFTIVLNATGIIVIWGKTSPQDDGCCDACEKSASGTGWIIYLILTLLMILFTIGLCVVFTLMLVKNDPKSDICPGITFDDTTTCGGDSCKDGHGGTMKASDCPIDFAIISTTYPDSPGNTGTWDSLQNLFTMCGYYCNGGNCSLANGDSDQKTADPAKLATTTATATNPASTATTPASIATTAASTARQRHLQAASTKAAGTKVQNTRYNPYLFQLTGKYCKEKVEKAGSMADPDNCDKCDAEYVDVAFPGYGVEEGASKTGLRDAFQFQFYSSGIPTTIFLYVLLAVEILNIICVGVITCVYKQKGAEGEQYTAKSRT